jgi:hypothetical protein
MRKFVEEAFARAVANEENVTSGKINMNFVEADVYAECVEQFGHPGMTEYLDIFDAVADKFIVDNNVEYC